MKSFIKVMAVLVLVPAVFLGGMAAYVHVAQPTGAGSILICTVDDPVLWPWQTLKIGLSIAPEQSSAATTQTAATDVLLLLDHSSSMESGDALGDALRAAQSFAYTLTGERFRVGVITFNESASLIQPLTSSGEEVLRALESVTGSGGTDISASLEEAGRVFSGPGPEPAAQRRAVILLSDGQSSSSEALAAAEGLKSQGVDVFAIGLGPAINEGLLLRISSHPHYYARTLDPGQLAGIYLEFGGRLADTLGFKGELLETVNTNLVSLPEKRTNPLQTRYDPAQGIIQWSLPVIFKKPIRLSYQPSPLISGILHPFADQAVLTFSNSEQQLITVRTKSRPLILVISWWLMAALLAPALIYSLIKLAQLMEGVLHRETSEEVEEVVPSPVAVDPPPLTTLPPRPTPPMQPTPTLFLGLGHCGRLALTHLKYLMGQVWGDAWPSAYQLLCLDVAHSEYAQNAALPVEVDGVSLDPGEVALVDSRVGKLAAQLNGMAQPPEWFSGWDSGLYATDAADSFDLAQGSNRRRGLARLALCQDLAQGESESQVASRIRQSLEALSPELAGGQELHIVLAASPMGGVGSSWMEPVAFAASRLARQVLSAQTSIVCEGHLLLGVEDLGAAGGRNLMAFSTELARLGMAGQRPLKMLFGPPGRPCPDMDGLLDRPLLDNIYCHSLESHPAGPAQAASFMATLADRQIRQQLTRHKMPSTPAGALASGWPRVCATSNTMLLLPVRAMAQRVKCRVLRHLFGAGMLLDLAEVDGNAGFRPMKADEALQVMHSWQELPHLEQNRPEMLAEFQRYLLGEPLQWTQWLAREASAPAENWARAKARAYGEYLAQGLDCLLHEPLVPGGDVRAARCGRLGVAYHLARALFTRFADFQKELKAQTGEAGPEPASQLLELAAQYQTVHRQLLGEMEAWALGLISPQAISDLEVVSEPQGPGFYQVLTAKEQKIDYFAEHTAPSLALRKTLLSQDLSELEESILADCKEQWVEGEEGLLARLWFEAAAPEGGQRLAPRLRLVFQGETKHRFGLESNLAEELWQHLGSVLDRINSQLWLRTVVTELRPGRGSSTLDPSQAAQWLAAAQFDLPPTEQAPPQRRRILIRPDGESLKNADQETEYLSALETELAKKIPDIWQPLTCQGGDPYSLRLVCTAHGAAINTLKEHRQAAGWGQDGGQEQQQMELLHAQDVRLEGHYRQTLSSLTGKTVPYFDPLLALLMDPPGRLHCFALLWAGGFIREQSGLQSGLVLEWKHIHLRLADSGEGQTGLFEAALHFMSCDPQARELEDWQQSPKSEEQLEALERTCNKLENDMSGMLAAPQSLDRDQQLRMLIWVELKYELNKQQP